MMTQYLKTIFNMDSLSIVMITLVVSLGIVIGVFASRYMQGDRLYRSFMIQLSLLVLSVIGLVCADNIYLFLALWASCNTLLVRLMIHKPEWLASRASGLLAAKTLGLGFVCLAIGLVLLAYQSNSTSIQSILTYSFASSYHLSISLALLTIAAMTQSAIWPFHRWLLSSLNSPTPVSALMHAGLVNGGGFLLVRFAPLYFSLPHFLTGIFVIGIFSAILGTLWKLMQNDVKRMLACSTMAQMGFMVVQCSLGLFPAAVAHLCWHGFFKGYLFLASGSAAQEKRLPVMSRPHITSLVLAMICGIATAYGFALITEKTWIELDSTLVLVFVAWIAGTQLGIVLLKNRLTRFPIALFMASLLGIAYGGSVELIQVILKPLDLMQPQPINFIHIIAIILLTFFWVANFLRYSINSKSRFLSGLLSWVYVKALNASQPHPETITTHKNDYKY